MGTQSNEDEDSGRSFAAGVRRATASIWAKCCKYTKSLFWAIVTAAQHIPDEAILIQHRKFDLDILSSVDAIHGDDEMLATIIPEALLYTCPNSRDLVHLIIQLLEHRVLTLEPSQRVVEYWPFYSMTPWDHLRPQARGYILSILFGHIKDLVFYGSCGYCFEVGSQYPGGICPDHIAIFRMLFLVTSAPRESLQLSAVVFLKMCFEVAGHQPGFWRWLCYSTATADNDASPKLDRALMVVRAINDLTNTGQIQLSLKNRVTYSTQIPHPYFPNLVDKHIDTTTYPWDTWQLADSYEDMRLKFSFMVFWLHAASEGLNSLHTETSADPPSLVTSVVGFSLRQFHGCWIGSSPYDETTALYTHCELVYNGFRKMAHVAVERRDTALMFTSALLDEFQPPPRFAYSMPLFGGSPLSRMLDSSYNRGNFTDFVHSALHSPLTTFTVEQSIQTPLRDPAVIQAICLLVMSKITMYQERELDITFRLGLCQVLAFFLIIIYVPQDLREECRRMFASLATSLLVSHSQASLALRDILWEPARGCLAIMEFEVCKFGKSDRPHSEEESIFPDMLLDILRRLTGEEYSDNPRHTPSRRKLDFGMGHSKLTLVTETQPAGEPDSTSAAVIDSTSTSNEVFNASDLVPGMSRGVLQPACAMEHVEQTKAAHEEEEEEEEENDV